MSTIRKASDPIAPSVDNFIHQGLREDAKVLKRRELLTRLLVSAGVAASVPFIESASAIASPLESDGEASYDHGLREVSRRVIAIGRAHMEPDADWKALTSSAIAAWRDAALIRSMVPTSALVRARATEAFAAGLVAQFYGDRGMTGWAEDWYKRAYLMAPNANTQMWLRSCHVWLPLYGGNPELAIEMGRTARGILRRAGGGEGERAAFANAQLARALASVGNVRGAASSFNVATSAFEGTDCDLHRTAPPNLFHFTIWQFSQYGAEVKAAIGDVKASRDFRSVALAAPNLNGMNRAVIELGEAELRIKENEAEGAVEHALTILRALPDTDRTSAVVVGRTNELSLKLNRAFSKSVPAVAEFTEYARALATAA